MTLSQTPSVLITNLKLLLYYLSQRKIKLRAAFFYAGDSIVSPGINWFLHSSGFIQLSSNRSWSLTRLVVIFISTEIQILLIGSLQFRVLVQFSCIFYFAVYFLNDFAMSTPIDCNTPSLRIVCLFNRFILHQCVLSQEGVSFFVDDIQLIALFFSSSHLDRMYITRILKTSKIIFKIPSTFSASFPLYREMKICLLIPAFNHVLSTAQIA